eukprot:2659128-Pyramimonas_sp.AAC.1
MGRRRPASLQESSEQLAVPRGSGAHDLPPPCPGRLSSPASPTSSVSPTGQKIRVASRKRPAPSARGCAS